MKRYEHKLLDRLTNNYQSEDVPLKNVKDALGRVGYTKGNPLTKTEITLNVSLWFWGGAGARILPAALPAALQVREPVWLFGLTDFYGGYNKQQRITPFAPIWINMQTGGIINYTVANTFPAFMNVVSGDYVFSLRNNALNINCAIVIHCNNVAYGTFLNSFVSDLITINTIRYIVPIANINQFINSLSFTYQTLFGKTYTDNIDPRMYISSTDFQQQVCDIPINLPIDKALMLGFYMEFDLQAFQMILFVEQVQPLTHK